MEDLKKIINSWGIKEAFPAYGIVFLGIFILIITEKEHWGIAFVKAFTSPDFLATSFAFIFTVLYSFPPNNENKGLCIWGLVFCVAFFVVTKLFPLEISDKWEIFWEKSNMVRVFAYAGLSIAAVLWTFAIVYQVKTAEIKNSGVE